MVLEKKKLHIMYVTNNYKPYSGGVVQSIDAGRNELMRQGHMVTVVTLDFTGQQETDPHVIRIPCPIKFLYRGNHMALPLMIDKPLRKIFEQKRPDVVHLHHPFLLCVSALKIAQEKKIPTFFTHHTQYGDYARCYVPFFKSLVAQFITYYVKNFCNQVGTIIAPSRSIKKQLKKQNITTPIYVIPSSIRPIFIHTVVPLKRTGTILKLLTVARFREEKNLFFILDALKKVHIPFTYMLIGYGDLEEQLKMYAYKICGFSVEQVVFVVNPNIKYLAQAYVDADIFLFASKTETQGLVFTEAMAAGTPCIALRAPGAQDCIIHRVNGILIDSKGAMAEEIERIYSNKNLYAQLSYNAYKFSKKNTVILPLHRLSRKDSGVF